MDTRGAVLPRLRHRTVHLASGDPGGPGQAQPRRNRVARRGDSRRRCRGAGAADVRADGDAGLRGVAAPERGGSLHCAARLACLPGEL